MHTLREWLRSNYRTPLVGTQRSVSIQQPLFLQPPHSWYSFRKVLPIIGRPIYTAILLVTTQRHMLSSREGCKSWNLGLLMPRSSGRTSIKSKNILHYAWILRNLRNRSKNRWSKGYFHYRWHSAGGFTRVRGKQRSLKNRTWGPHPVSSTLVGPMPEQGGTGVLQQPGPMRRDRA